MISVSVEPTFRCGRGTGANFFSTGSAVAAQHIPYQSAEIAVLSWPRLKDNSRALNQAHRGQGRDETMGAI
jgi:hypothetical protein